mgnify:CR=1 FL=1
MAKSIFRSVIAIILGLVVGSFLNMGTILLGHQLIPVPDGADVSSIEGLQATIHLFEPKHFIFPLLAHALGTFVGALLAGFISIGRPLLHCMIIGVAFLIGGIINVFSLPTSVLVNTIDLTLAYIPMALLAYWIVIRLKQQ